jgi:hypothetical protein
VRLERDEALRRAAAADHGILATLHSERGADLVPACFALQGGVVAIPIERVKPKVAAELGRVRNLAADPRGTLLVEGWDPVDWSCLWWVRLTLRRSVEAPATVEALAAGLRDRYPQYREAAFEDLLTFRIEAVAGWAAA